MMGMLPPNARRPALFLTAIAALSCRSADAFTSSSPRVRPAARMALRDGEGKVEAEATGVDGSDCRTLYDVLRSHPNATRDELKRSYVRLARKSHPDAILGRGDIRSEDAPDFNEIARAWRTLGDPISRRRYDRRLGAERFADGLAGIAGQVSEGVVPVMAKILGDVAVPFIRSTTATAAAGLMAVGENLASRRENSSDASTQVDSEGKAREDAGAVVEPVETEVKKGKKKKRAENSRLPTMEKSRDLERNRSGGFTFQSDAYELTSEIELLEDFERAWAKREMEKEYCQRRLDARRAMLWRAEIKATEQPTKAELRTKNAILDVNGTEVLEASGADFKARLANIAHPPPTPKTSSPAVDGTQANELFFPVPEGSSSGAMAVALPTSPVTYLDLLSVAPSVVAASGGAEGYLDLLSFPGATSQALGGVGPVSCLDSLSSAMEDSIAVAVVTNGEGKGVGAGSHLDEISQARP